MLKVPCLTLRENTERPGHGRGRDQPPRRARTRRGSVRRPSGSIRDGVATAGVPPLWDGRAAERIVDVLVARYGRSDDDGKEETA